MTRCFVKAVFALIVVVHGMIHLMGFAKAFRYAEIAQLHESITRPAGVLWLLAALLFAASAFLLFAAPASLWGILSRLA